jgi:hypothetical protein
VVEGEGRRNPPKTTASGKTLIRLMGSPRKKKEREREKEREMRFKKITTGVVVNDDL